MPRLRLFPIRMETVILLAGLAIYILQMATPHSGEYAYDTGSHAEHIKFIADHWRIPMPDDCYECHQPFLYYTVSAVAMEIGRILGVSHPMAGVRLLALATYMIYILLGRCLLQSYLPSIASCRLALALLVFWPIGITKASVVGNDVAEALTQLACLYYLTQWWRSPEPKLLEKSLLWNALAIAVKQNGIILCPVIALTVLCRRRWNAFPLWATIKDRKILFSCAALAFVALMVFGRTYVYYRWTVDPEYSWSVMNPKIVLVDYYMQLGDEDSTACYVTFNIEGFFQEPFFDPRDPDTDRCYIWNSLFKSALFGEFKFREETTAMLLDTLELAMAAYIALTGLIALIRKEFDPSLVPLYIFIGLELAMIITARALYPTANNEDFRFIYAVTAVMAVLYGKAMMWHEKHHNLSSLWIGRGFAMVFVAASVTLIIVQDRYEFLSP